MLKRNNYDDPRAQRVLPSVNDPTARGNYSCKVGNSIPTHDYEVQSKPLFLDVKCEYSPGFTFSASPSFFYEKPTRVKYGVVYFFPSLSPSLPVAYFSLCQRA